MDLHFNVSMLKVRKNWWGKAAASVLQFRWISSSLLCCWAGRGNSHFFKVEICIEKQNLCILLSRRNIPPLGVIIAACKEKQSICCSWKIECLLFPMGCGEWVLTVWCPSFFLFQWLAQLWQNFQQTLPEQYLGNFLGADKRLLNQNSFY